MSKRYYLSRMVWVDRRGWMPKAGTFPGVQWSAVMPADPAAKGAWALVVVEAKQHAALIADADIRALPDFVLDGKMAALGNQASKTLDSAMSSFGIDGTAIKANAGAYRDILRGIGKQNLETFDENDFDAAVS